MRLDRVGRKILGLCNARERRWLIVLVGMMFIGAGLEVLGISLIVPFVGLLSNPETLREYSVLNTLQDAFGAVSGREFLFVLGVMLLVTYVLKNIYLAFLVYAQSRFLFNKQAALARTLFGSYMHRPYTFHLQQDTAILLRNITQEAINVANGIMLPFLQFLTEVMVLVMVVVFLFAMEPLVATIALLVLGITAAAIFIGIGGTMTHQGNVRKKYAGRMIKWVQHGLGGIKESKILGRESYFIQQFADSSQRYVRSARIYAILNVAPRLIIETVVVVMLLLVVLLVLGREGGGQSIVATIALFTVAAVRLMPSVNRMTTSLNSMRYYMPALDTCAKEFAWLDGEDVRVESSAKSSGPEELSFNTIEIKNLHFRYESADADALNGINLIINRGEIIALTGPSGGGKSTLVDAILGLHKPAQGDILIDGQSLSGMTGDWQRNIGYVPQSIYLTDGTIANNVAFGVPDAEIDWQHLMAVLERARLSTLVKRLPNGVDTEVGERGVRLSGGERQRIGIARALYNDAQILALDEATSALDNETERLVTRALQDIAKERTVIIIAHRLATVRLCDKIHVIESGSIIESGSYSELMQLRGVFSHMVNAHSFVE